uniref:Uncharacterized protein n=1 Tax=Cacopsylla melanoneura TaxID=428564 RepID=A0A8D8QJY9_9HEMI
MTLCYHHHCWNYLHLHCTLSLYLKSNTGFPCLDLFYHRIDEEASVSYGAKASDYLRSLFQHSLSPTLSQLLLLFSYAVENKPPAIVSVWILRWISEFLV